MKPIEIKGIKIGEGMPKICVPIVGETKEEILTQAREISSGLADMVEWRADWYADCLEIEKVEEVLEMLREELEPMPIIFTFRTKAEGGEREISYEDYERLLKNAARTKHIDFVDVEVFKEEKIQELIREIKKEGMKVIGSNHDFEKTPEKEKIIERLRYMQELGVDIPKIAVMPRNEEDVYILMEATKEMSLQYAKGPIVAMSMGELGKVSRVEGEHFGSAITFGTMGKASAPGQISVLELKSMLEKLHITAKA